MLSTVFKHRGNWEFQARIFWLKGQNYERLIFGVSDVIVPVLYEKCFERSLQTYSIAMLNSQNKLFANFPSASDAIDVCLQQSLRLTGTMKEAQPYYSGKHKLHRFKFE